MVFVGSMGSRGRLDSTTTSRLVQGATLILNSLIFLCLCLRIHLKYCWCRLRTWKLTVFPAVKVCFYNNIFPKHKERLTKRLSDLVQSVAKLEIPVSRKYFDIVVACEDADGEDLDVPLITIQFR